MKRVFISYSFGDVAAREIISELTRIQGNDILFYNPLDDVAIGSDWREVLEQEVRRSSALIAFTGLASPNVVFEAGFAFGVGRPVLIVADSAENIPLPFRSMQVLLKSDGPGYLTDRILRWVDGVSIREPKASEPMALLDILDSLQSNTEAYLELSGRIFEQAVLRTFEEVGIFVSFPPESIPGDAGFDAIVTSPDGTQWSIEIKKFRPMSKASIADVHRLVGAATMNGIRNMILVCPTGFTESARSYVAGADLNMRLVGESELRAIMKGDLRALFG